MSDDKKRLEATSAPSGPELVWRTIERRQREDYRVFRTVQQVAAHPRTGQQREFAVIESPDWVNIIALTTENEVVLIRQHRHGVDHVTLEIPGGAVDPGETHRDAAERELREETGYVAERWRELGTVHPNPALQNNQCSSWLALDARVSGGPRPDEGEVIAVERAPLADIGRRIASGEITHALVVSAFFYLSQLAGGLRRPFPP